MNDYQTIPFVLDDGTEQDFIILEQTILNGASYLLVTDDQDSDAEESDAYILKECLGSEKEGTVAYEFLEDEEELEAVFAIFEQLLDDTDLSVSR